MFCIFKNLNIIILIKDMKQNQILGNVNDFENT